MHNNIRRIAQQTLFLNPISNLFLMPAKNNLSITLGAGCFWCVEAVFQQLKGVTKVLSGYTGGHVINPTYDDICSKQSGHVEVCQVHYNADEVTLAEILEVFWLTHDPTTLNKQGADVGPQYRSVIFYNNDKEKEIAETLKLQLNQSGAFAKGIVTAIEPVSTFYTAETYHQNYYINNPNQGYCYYVIKPKLEKFHKVFANKAK